MNNNACEPVILVEDHAQHSLCIVQCRHCSRVGLMFNNLLADFDPEDFQSFASAIIRLEFDRCAMAVPGGDKKIFIHTCHKDIHFCFSAAEFELVKEAFQQAKLLLEASTLVSKRN